MKHICGKCGGKKRLEEYVGVNGGLCWQCQGKGYTFGKDDKLSTTDIIAAKEFGLGKRQTLELLRFYRSDCGQPFSSVELFIELGLAEYDEQNKSWKPVWIVDEKTIYPLIDWRDYLVD